MPTSKRPRKAYRPKVANTAATANAMNAVTLLTAEEREKCAGAPERALQAFIAGDDPAFQWAVMADALNVAEALSDVGICSDLASGETIAKGQMALVALHPTLQNQATADAAMLVDDQPRKALARAVELHRIQLTLCDYSEYRRAVDTVMRKAAGARAGNVAPGTTILEAAK